MSVRTRIAPWLLTFSLMPAAALAVNNCYIDDPSLLTPLGTPIQSNEEFAGGSVCGHRVEGTNCVLQIKGDQSGSASTNCLTLGKGVTVDLEGHSFGCTAGTKCGSAIVVTDSAGSANKVVVKNGSINGCWTKGVERSNGSNDQVLEMTVDLDAAGSCPSDGDTGLYRVSTVTQSIVKNAAQECILVSGGLIEHSIATDCGAGITVMAISTVNNSLVTDNGINVRQQWLGMGYGYLTAKSSAFQDASTCQCAQQSFSPPGYTCDGACNALTFTGDPSFVDTTIN